MVKYAICGFLYRSILLFFSWLVWSISIGGCTKNTQLYRSHVGKTGEKLNGKNWPIYEELVMHVVRMCRGWTHTSSLPGSEEKPSICYL